VGAVGGVNANTTQVPAVVSEEKYGQTTILENNMDFFFTFEKAD